MLVQIGGGPCSAACSSHTQIYHGGARGTLLCRTPPLGEKIPTSVMPAHVDDFVPTEEEVKWVVKRLQGHRSGGLSWMLVKHLRECLWEH